MGWFSKGMVGAAVLAGTTFITTEASAIKPVPQGTFAVSAERLFASNFEFYPGGPTWTNQFFGAPVGTAPFGTPRLGVDYFVIDGLSLGTHLGFGFAVDPGPNDPVYFSMIPRVGYAFGLGNVVDFWPRLGVGFIGGSFVQETAVVSLEGMFLFNLKRYFAIELGPALDLPLADFWPDAILGANAGFVVKF